MKELIKLFEVIEGKYYYNNKEVKESFNSQGYSRLYIDGKARRTHRLIAIKYIPNPLGLKNVDHIDGNKNNNNKSNLRWVTSSENSISAYRSNKTMENMHNPSKRRTILSSKEGVINEHKSFRDCAKFLNRDVSAVYRSLSKEWKFCNGHVLSYK